MSQQLSELNLREDVERARAVPDAARWKLEMPGDLEIWVTMCPASASQEIYQARLLWQQYPGAPPSLKFRDPQTGRLDLSQAWPKVRGFRPANLDACVNWCLEGLNLHPEWKNDPRYRWDSHGNVLLRTLRILQDELDNYYEGRFQ